MHRILLLMGCLLLLNHGVQAAELPLTSGRCFASSAPPVMAYTSDRKASTMTVEPRLL